MAEVTLSRDPGRRGTTRLKVYRIALIISLLVNAILIGGVALYIHFAGLLDLVETVVGIVN